MVYIPCTGQDNDEDIVCKFLYEHKIVKEINEMLITRTSRFYITQFFKDIVIECFINIVKVRNFDCTR